MHTRIDIQYTCKKEHLCAHTHKGWKYWWLMIQAVVTIDLQALQWGAHN